MMRQWRINFIFILIFLFSATIIGRLIFIQILNHENWAAFAKGQQKLFLQIPAERGEILMKDKNGNFYKLAINKKWNLVYVAPTEIEKKEETAEILSQNLNLDKEFILDKIQNESFYEIIKNRISDQEIDNIRKLKLLGVYLGEESGRYYPQKNLASHVVGFLGGDGQGQYGLEEYYNDILAGKAGYQEGERSVQGFFLSFSEKLSPAKGGEDLTLTLDYNVQFMAEKLLAKAKEDLEIEEGTIIVADPNSGKIIAMANFPSFDPNSYSEVEDWDVFQNSAIQKIFEPGSVFKPIVMAAALDKEKITPETTYVDEGVVKVGGWTIKNFASKTWGKRTMTEVLEKSINTGAVFAETQVGHQFFQEYIDKFGFFQPTKIDLAGEIFSQNPEFKKGYEINFATASFGQGIEMTPLQLAMAFSVIANGGKLITPYIAENSPKNENLPGSGEQIISQKTVSQLTKMLVNVVEKGYAKEAKIPGYYTAGKTGTAQVSFSALGESKAGYSGKTIQSFAGFFPAFNPKFLILVKLNNPKASTAEYSAVPIFHELSKYIIDYYQIPPDYVEEEQQNP